MQNSNEHSDVYQCPFLEECEFIQNNFEKMPELIQRTKERYCTRTEAECARRCLNETYGSAVIPPLMLPEQTAWAQQIMEDMDSDKQVTTPQ